MSRKSKSTPKSGASRSRKPVPLSAVIAKVAASRYGGDTTKAGKAVRSHLRRNYATLEGDGYKGLTKTKTSANDGNRWPVMPASFAGKVVKRLS